MGQTDPQHAAPAGGCMLAQIHTSLSSRACALINPSGPHLLLRAWRSSDSACCSAFSAAASSFAAAWASAAATRGAAFPSRIRPPRGLPPPPDMVPDSAAHGAATANTSQWCCKVLLWVLHMQRHPMGQNWAGICLVLRAKAACWQVGCKEFSAARTCDELPCNGHHTCEAPVASAICDPAGLLQVLCDQRVAQRIPVVAHDGTYSTTQLGALTDMFPAPSDKQGTNL